MSWINTTKPTSTFTNATKPSTTWADNVEYLISEALAFLITENNNYIITNQSLAAKPFTIWANIAK